MHRAMTIDMDHASGRTTITVLGPRDNPHAIARVTIREIDATGERGTRWEVKALGSSERHRYGTLETAFRNAMLSAVQLVTEELLPTRPS